MIHCNGCQHEHPLNAAFLREITKYRKLNYQRLSVGTLIPILHFLRCTKCGAQRLTAFSERVCLDCGNAIEPDRLNENNKAVWCKSCRTKRMKEIDIHRFEGESSRQAVAGFHAEGMFYRSRFCGNVRESSILQQTTNAPSADRSNVLNVLAGLVVVILSKKSIHTARQNLEPRSVNKEDLTERNIYTKFISPIVTLLEATLHEDLP